MRKLKPRRLRSVTDGSGVNSWHLREERLGPEMEVCNLPQGAPILLLEFVSRSLNVTIGWCAAGEMEEHAKAEQHCRSHTRPLQLLRAVTCPSAGLRDVLMLACTCTSTALQKRRLINTAPSSSIALAPLTWEIAGCPLWDSPHGQKTLT